MAIQEEFSEKNKPRRLRVLVAEDNKTTAECWERLLASWGYEVLLAYDGITALQMGKDHLPDVALLDLGLPGLDGYRVAQRLRECPALVNTVLIAVTGHQWQNAHLRSEQYGFNHHLVKPVDSNCLHDLISTIQNPSVSNDH
jgi:CheY-like chemotaxis protein